MMNKVEVSYLVIALMIALTSCEEVIEIDLNDSPRQLVIEGVILDSIAGNFVKISKSVNFDEPNLFEAISNATVSIADEQGSIFQLSETLPGYYTNPVLKGNYGESYKLVATVEGLVITANAVMASKVKYDSLIVEENVTAFGDGGDYRVRVYFTDPANERNYYYMKIYLNGVREDQAALLDDIIFDGKSTSFPIFFYGYDIGDVVSVELFSISEQMFKYYNALSNNSDNSFFSAAPGNPQGNYDNDILGYFAGFSVATNTVQIQ